MTKKNRKQVRPIRPCEIDQTKRIPQAVLKAFNELIAEKYCDGRAHFDQSEVVAAIVKKGLKRKEIFEKGWLDVERIYRVAGWEVRYDKPGWDETYEPNFTFSVR
jgi:hypothetical protein